MENVPAFTLAFLRSSADGVLLLNSDDRVSFVSERGQVLLELGSPGPITARPWWELWPEEEQVRLRAALDRARDGATERLRGHCETLAGRLRHWDVTVSPVTNRAGEVESLMVILRPLD